MSIERFFPNAPLKDQIYPKVTTSRPPPIVLPPCSSLLLTPPSSTPVTTGYEFRVLKPSSAIYTPSSTSARFSTPPIPPTSQAGRHKPTLPSFASLFGGSWEVSHCRRNFSPYMVPKLHVPELPTVDRVDGAACLEIGDEPPKNAGANTTDSGVSSPDTIQCGWPGCNTFKNRANGEFWAEHIESHWEEFRRQNEPTGSRCRRYGCGSIIRRGGWGNHVRWHDHRFRKYCPMCPNKFFSSTPSLASHLDEFHPLPTGQGASGSQVRRNGHGGGAMEEQTAGRGV